MANWLIDNLERKLHENMVETERLRQQIRALRDELERRGGSA